MSKIKVGDVVYWKWAGSVAQGVVIEISDSRTEVISKGKLIVRNGTVDNPAVVIEHNSGNHVLKLSSELIDK